MCVPGKNAERAVTTSLAGRRIALLEARLATEASALVRRLGGMPVSVPALREEAVSATAMVTAFLDRLAAGEIAFVIFQTGVGVNALFDEAAVLGRDEALREGLGRVGIVSRGPKPGRGACLARPSSRLHRALPLHHRRAARGSGTPARGARGRRHRELRRAQRGPEPCPRGAGRAHRGADPLRVASARGHGSPARPRRSDPRRGGRRGDLHHPGPGPASLRGDRPEPATGAGRSPRSAGGDGGGGPHLRPGPARVRNRRHRRSREPQTGAALRGPGNPPRGAPQGPREPRHRP